MAWNDDNNNGPWGKKRPSSNGTGNRKGEDPSTDFEDLFKKGSQGFKKIIGDGGGKGGNPNGIALLVVIVGLLLWFGTGFYRVGEPDRGIVTRFGKFEREVGQGLHYHLPSPIENVKIVNVSNIRTFQNDTTLKGTRNYQSLRGEDITNMMLTGDENILKVRYSVQWYIKNPVDFVFNDPNPQETVKLAADSAVREIIAQSTMDEARTSGKAEIIKKSKALLQKLLDEYKVGIEVVKINLEEVTPPASVIDAFRDVQRAIADKERTINLARAYQNSIVPVARGKAQQIIEAAEAEKLATINMAQGETARFESLLKEYLKAPDLTAKRLRIQNAQKVLTGINKMVLALPEGGSGVVPYLPLKGLTPEKHQSASANKTSTLLKAQREVSQKAQKQAAAEQTHEKH